MGTITVNNNYSALYGWKSFTAYEVLDASTEDKEELKTHYENIKHISFNNFETNAEIFDGGGEDMFWSFGNDSDILYFGKSPNEQLEKVFVRIGDYKIYLTATEFEDFLNNGFTNYTTSDGTFNYDSPISKVITNKYIDIEQEDASEKLRDKFLNNIIFYYKD